MYPDAFAVELTSLPTKKQFLFGLSNVERTIHFYETFEEEWEVNQPFSTMVAALELGYQYVLNENQVTIAELTQMMNIVETGIPDGDEYNGSLLVTRAQNAALILYCSLKYAVEEITASLIEAGERVIDIVDSIEQEKYTQYVNTDPLTDQEIALQLDFMEYITNMEVTNETVLDLRRLSQQNRL